MDDVALFMTIDLAISTKRTADPTVMAVWGVDKAKNLLLLDVARQRIPGPSQLKLLERLNDEWAPDRIVCEDVVYQRSFVDHAQERGLPVVGVKPKGSKDARAIPAATRMEAGQVFFPAEAPWLEDLENELLSFPNGRHDDQVDVLSYAAGEITHRTRRRGRMTGWTLDPDLMKPCGITTARWGWTTPWEYWAILAGANAMSTMSWYSSVGEPKCSDVLGWRSWP